MHLRARRKHPAAGALIAADNRMTSRARATSPGHQSGPPSLVPASRGGKRGGEGGEGSCEAACVECRRRRTRVGRQEGDALGAALVGLSSRAAATMVFLARGRQRWCFWRAVAGCQEGTRGRQGIARRRRLGVGGFGLGVELKEHSRRCDYSMQKGSSVNSYAQPMLRGAAAEAVPPSTRHRFGGGGEASSPWWQPPGNERRAPIAPPTAERDTRRSR